MKLFAVIALLAMVVYVSADNAVSDGSNFVGELQDNEGGDTIKIGHYNECVDVIGMESAEPRGIPSCKLGPKWGNPICFAKCVSRGHAGGSCAGKKCVCVD